MSEVTKTVPWKSKTAEKEKERESHKVKDYRERIPRERDRDHERDREKDRDKEKERKTRSQKTQVERLKTVVRRLPPNLPEDVFWKSVEQWVTEDTVTWKEYYQGKFRKRYALVISYERVI